MKALPNEGDNYPLPLTIHSKFKFKTHFLFITMIPFFSLPFILPFDDNGFQLIIFKAFSAIFIFLFTIFWIYTGVLKKAYITISDYSICAHSLFGTKTVKWTDIAELHILTRNKENMIGVQTKQQLKKKKENLADFLSTQMGGNYTLTISLKIFPDYSPEKLYAIMSYCLKTIPQTNDIEDMDEYSEKFYNYSFPIAFIKSFFISLLMGLLYGGSILLFKINFMLIPLFGILPISYFYFKNFRKNTINIFMRILLGFLNAIPVLIAPLIVLLLSNLDYIKFIGIFNAIAIFTSSMIKTPSSYMQFYVISVVVFLLGVFFDSSFHFLRRFKKPLLSKQNGFTVEKHQNNITIYFIDYQTYNESSTKLSVDLDANSCMIEKSKKKLLAFYLPIKAIHECQIQLSNSNLEYIKIHDQGYYKIDLGSKAKPTSYLYPCTLILNEDREIEFLQLIL